MPKNIPLIIDRVTETDILLATAVALTATVLLTMTEDGVLNWDKNTITLAQQIAMTFVFAGISTNVINAIVDHCRKQKERAANRKIQSGNYEQMDEKASDHENGPAQESTTFTLTINESMISARSKMANVSHFATQACFGIATGGAAVTLATGVELPPEATLGLFVGGFTFLFISLATHYCKKGLGTTPDEKFRAATDAVLAGGALAGFTFSLLMLIPLLLKDQSPAMVNGTSTTPSNEDQTGYQAAKYTNGLIAAGAFTIRGLHAAAREIPLACINEERLTSPKLGN